MPRYLELQQRVVGILTDAIAQGQASLDWPPFLGPCHMHCVNSTTPPFDLLLKASFIPIWWNQESGYQTVELIDFFNSFEGLVATILSLFVGVNQLLRILPFRFHRAVNQCIALRIIIAASVVLFAAIILIVRNRNGG